MITGFNNILPLLRDLFNDWAKAEALASELRKLPAHKKVLRFPAGTGGKTYFFDEEFTLDFLKFCLLSEVTFITIVVNPSDIDGFFKTHEIISSKITITLIEFDNENYLRSHIQKDTKWNELGLLLFNYPKLLQKKAQEYKYQFRLFNASINTYNIINGNKIVAPIALVADIPNDYKSSIWFDELKDISENVIIHIYGELHENYIDGLSSALNRMSTHNIYITEYNAIHFGDNIYSVKNRDEYLSVNHRNLNIKIQRLLKSKPNVKMILQHCLFDIEQENRDQNLYTNYYIRMNNAIEYIYQYWTKS